MDSYVQITSTHTLIQGHGILYIELNNIWDTVDLIPGWNQPTLKQSIKVII